MDYRTDLRACGPPYTPEVVADAEGGETEKGERDWQSQSGEEQLAAPDGKTLPSKSLSEEKHAQFQTGIEPMLQKLTGEVHVRRNKFDVAAEEWILKGGFEESDTRQLWTKA